jgi:hypothetical protein
LTQNEDMLDGRSLVIHGTAFPLLCAAEPACCLPAAKNDSDVRKGSALGRSIKRLPRGAARHVHVRQFFDTAQQDAEPLANYATVAIAHLYPSVRGGQSRGEVYRPCLGSLRAVRHKFEGQQALGNQAHLGSAHEGLHEGGGCTHQRPRRRVP